MQHQAFKFRLTKQDGGEGRFEGWLSVYGNLDAGGDVVEKGAFQKTLTENQGRFPLLWAHDSRSPVGFLDAEDKPKGLFIKGTLLIDHVERAREAYALIKAGVVKGLSIGYEALKHRMDGQVRRLLEVKLLEGSLVLFPMNEEARLVSVKDTDAVRLAALKIILSAAEKAVRTAQGNK